MSVAGKQQRPPAIILGGSANSLSVTRSLGRSGIQVLVAGLAGTPALDSRFCSKRFLIRDRSSFAKECSELLLSGAGQPTGAVLLPCDDDSVEFVAKNHEALSRNYVLDGSDPAIQLAMLDKQRTLEMARAADIPIPKSMAADLTTEIDQILSEIALPAILKPVHSHLFQRKFGRGGRKFFWATTPEELHTDLQLTCQAGLEMIVAEFIPGPDSLLGSYYTYIDDEGHSHFHFTKKIIRRYPQGEGLGSFHKTEWDEEIAEIGARFFRKISFRGLGNVEFKRDLRDDQLKLIECNPRFTAAQELLVRAGIDAAQIVYSDRIGEPTISRKGFRQQLHFWYPVRDLMAFRERSRKGELSLGAWLKGVCRKQVLPFFSMADPRPSVLRMARASIERFAKAVYR